MSLSVPDLSLFGHLSQGVATSSLYMPFHHALCAGSVMPQLLCKNWHPAILHLSMLITFDILHAWFCPTFYLNWPLETFPILLTKFDQVVTSHWISGLGKFHVAWNPLIMLHNMRLGWFFNYLEHFVLGTVNCLEKHETCHMRLLCCESCNEEYCTKAKVIDKLDKTLTS